MAQDLGDLGRAAGYCAEALQVARDLGQKGGLATASDGLALVTAHRGDPERALVLFGAAAGLRGTTGMVSPPGWPERIGRGMTIARAGLSQEMAAALLERGRALRPDELAVFAIDHSIVGAPHPRVVDAASRYQPDDSAHVNRSALPSRQRPGGLTDRQLEVARLVGKGRTNREIAAQLVVSERTAEHHVENILAKLALSSRTQVGIWAVEHGLTADAPLSS